MEKNVKELLKILTAIGCLFLLAAIMGLTWGVFKHFSQLALNFVGN